jgi:hypothetical protein
MTTRTDEVACGEVPGDYIFNAFALTVNTHIFA